jgi:hydroxymethylpyrimidine pyrophosphatase-like HAD family hydrolase
MSASPVLTRARTWSASLLMSYPASLMRYVALAAAFDGTLARDGRCDERCIDALRALAATGRKLILVTSRQLRELLEIFPEARIFDYVVAENGAVMYCPATRQSAILAQAPSELLVQELRHRRVSPMSVGSSSITTLQSNKERIQGVMHKLGLDCQLVSNDDVISILPAGVDKAYGVQAALRELGVSRHNLVAIGDGENDIALFSFAEHAAAVRNANPALQHVADRTTDGPCCDGFLQFAHELIETDLAAAPPRRRLLLGNLDDGQKLYVAPCRDSLLVCGPTGAGKSAVCEALLQQFLAQEYQCCVIEAEMTGALSVRRGMTLLGEPHEAPRLTDVVNALEQPGVSASVNLAGLAPETRPMFTEALMLQLQALHDRVGRPHCILIDHADSVLTREAAAWSARLSEITMVYVTSEPQLLPASVVHSIKLIVVPGEPSNTLATLRSEFPQLITQPAEGATADGVRRMSVVHRPGSDRRGPILASGVASAY